MSAASILDEIERKLQEIKASVQQVEGLLPSLREALANRPENDIEIPTTSAAIAPPTADQPEYRQRVVKSEPEDEPEAEIPGEMEEKPQIHQGQKRKVEESEAPSPKRARGPEMSNNNFAIFNYKGPLEGVTPEDVVRTLPLLGVKGLFMASDIELLDPSFKNAYIIGITCLRFKIHGLMADQLRNWVNGQSYVEDSHLENTKYCSHFSQHSYLINDAQLQPVSLFALLFLVAPEIETFVKTPVKLAPTHLEFRVPGGKRTVLTIKELIKEEWISMAKKAYNKITRDGRRALNLRVHMLGYPQAIWK